MRHKILLAFGFLIWATTASALEFQSGDWRASKIGNTCYIHTQRAAPHTSGTLIFGFGQGGYNASFQYEYTAWPGETEAPWSEDDSVVLEVDGTESWLGDEMFTQVRNGNYVADMASGFVSDMVMNMFSAQNTLTVAFDRPSLGETWVYGVFSPQGFHESMSQAATWCAFEPRNLPSS